VATEGASSVTDGVGVGEAEPPKVSGAGVEPSVTGMGAADPVTVTLGSTESRGSDRGGRVTTATMLNREMSK